MALLAGFEINEVPKEEMEEAWHLLEVAYAKDEVWTCVFQDVKNLEEIHPWIMENIAPRWNMPDIKTYQVKDLSNGCVLLSLSICKDDYVLTYVQENGCLDCPRISLEVRPRDDGGAQGSCLG